MRENFGRDGGIERPYWGPSYKAELEFVYSVGWGTLLTECVGGEICRLSEEEVDRKTPKTPPVKIVSGKVRLTRIKSARSLFFVPQNCST